MKRIIIAFLLIIIFTAGGLSCNSSQSQAVMSSLQSDGAGNVFTVYRLERSAGDHDIYLQKVGTEGSTIWEKTLFTGDNRRAKILGMVSDGSDGVFVAWEILTPENGKEGPHHFDNNILIRVDGQGEIKLNQNFYIRGMQMVADGTGGVILGWATEEEHRVLREDGNGSTLWAHPISSRGTGLVLSAGENGESFILWRHLDNPYFVVQKLSADGQTLWGEEGMPEGVRIKHLDTALSPEPQIISDGTGGAIVSWAEVVGGEMPSYVWLCRIGDDGQVLSTNPIRDLISTINTQVRAVADGEIGVIVVWEDHRKGMSLYSQRDNPVSSFLPPENGVPVCTNLPDASPRFGALRGQDAGLVVAWIDGDRRLCAQKLDSDGQKQWGDEGILIAEGVCDLPVMITNAKQNGVVIGWCTGEDTHVPENSFIQRIDLEGNILWENGIKLFKQGK
jgi:hypothetical protein